MHSVKHSRKLAIATALLVLRTCLEFLGKIIFHNIKCLYCSLTLLALILLYSGHLFSVWLPTKITCSFPHHFRLPALHNNAPQHITMFLDNIIAAHDVYLYAVMESTEWVFELLVIVYTDNLKRSIHTPIH